MTSDDALDQLRHIARERAFGRHVGSDRLIQAGLDALIAGVESPSLAMLAGLLRSEEPEAPELFDQVLEELGLLFHPPADPRAAKWAMAYWIAGQIADGSLDPAVGTHLIWADISYDLGYPEGLEPLVHCAHNLDGWEESWGVSVEELNRESVEAAKQFLRACRELTRRFDLVFVDVEESRDVSRCAKTGGRGRDVNSVGFQEWSDVFRCAADGHGGGVEELAQEVHGR